MDKNIRIITERKFVSVLKGGDNLNIKAFFIVAVIYFLILYLIAFFSHKGYKEEDDILLISRSQWGALFVMWLPILALLFKN